MLENRSSGYVGLLLFVKSAFQGLVSINVFANCTVELTCTQERGSPALLMIAATLVIVSGM